MPDEYTMVPVPTALVMDVMSYVVELSGLTRRIDQQPAQDSLIELSYEESTEPMRKFLDLLIDRAPAWLYIGEVRDLIGLAENPHILPGVLSTFTRRWKNRYGQKFVPMPFETLGTGEDRRYRMTAEVAAVMAAPREVARSQKAIIDEMRKPK